MTLVKANNKHKSSQLALTLATIISVVSILIWLISKFHFLTNFNSEPTNGAFQLLNPMRRLLHGDIAGKDFFPFHGLGTVLLHYPLFYILGGDFLASEFSRIIISPAAFITSTFFFFKALKSGNRLSLILTAISIFLLEIFRLFETAQPGNALLGVRSIGPLLIATTWIFVSNETQRKSVLFFTLITSFLVGLSIFIGTEQGLATLAAIVLVCSLYPPTPLKLRQRFLVVVSICLLSFASLFTITTLASQGNGFELLKFTLITIPKDQIWYFGVPPNNYLKNWTDILFEQTTISRFIISFLIGLIVIITRRIPKFRIYLSQPAVSSFMLLLMQGCIALLGNLGYTSPHYSEPLMRATIIISLALSIVFLKQTSEYQSLAKYLSLPRSLAVICLSLFCLSESALLFSRSTRTPGEKISLSDIEEYQETSPFDISRSIDGVRASLRWAISITNIRDCIGIDVRKVTIQEAVPAILVSDRSPVLLLKIKEIEKMRDLIPGDMVKIAPNQWRRIIDFSYDVLTVENPPPSFDLKLLNKEIYIKYGLGSQKNKDRDILWSTYSGVIESQLGILHPSIDYIIHALGDEQESKYLSKFKDLSPEYVLSINPKASRYEEWIQNTSWEFYENLLEKYTLVLSTPLYLLWQKSANVPPTASTQINWLELKSESKNTYRISANSERKSVLFAVNIDYSVNNPYQWLPLIGLTPRLFIEKKGSKFTLPISLPPYGNSFSFPVILDENDVLLTTNVVSPFNLPADLTISRVRIKPILKKETEILAMTGRLSKPINVCLNRQ